MTKRGARTHKRPGPAPKPEAEKVASLIRVYFTPQDLDRVRAAADAAGVSWSEYCRDAVLATLPPPPAEEG